MARSGDQPDTASASRLEQWLFPLFVAIVLLLGGVAVYVWQGGRAIQADVDALARRDLALMLRISRLKSDFLDQSLALQRLYATADIDAFDASDGARRLRIRGCVEMVRESCPRCPGLERLEMAQSVIEKHGAQLAGVMNAERVDWDAARAHLYAADTEAGTSDAILRQWAEQIESRVESSRRMVETTTRRVIWSVMGIAATITVIAGFLGYYTWRNVVEGRERRRLARFPERNPLPVFNLSLAGEVLYANPAAREMAARLLADAGQVSGLLPGDIRQGRLPASAGQGESQQTWEYPIGASILHCVVHCMDDLGGCHAYVRDITAQRQAEAQLRHQATHDAITGLPNLRAFQERLDEALTGEGRGAVLLLHLDRYRGVVDTLGHAAGDDVLRAVGERLTELVTTTSSTCCVHRLEGELFAILLHGPDPSQAAAEMAGRVAGIMQSPLAWQERALFFAFNMGACVFPEDGEDRVTLLRRADMALRQAMLAGSAYLRYVADLDHQALARLEMEHALRHAERRGELELHYQPQVALEDGRVIGVEALVRWRHPARGLIAPAAFIPLAEETGMIVPMGEWILANACAANKAWQRAGLPPMVVAVNLSPRQFTDPGLPALVERVLTESGLDPAWLELEITEGAAMHDLKQAVTTLHAFKALGVRLSIDDFGTGHSSLAYLSRFPIDKLKLDQSFVRNMERDARDVAIARSVVALGRGLGLSVIAEGVETAGQRDELRAMGCQEAQGYLYSRPLPADAIAAFVSNPRAAGEETA